MHFARFAVIVTQNHPISRDLFNIYVDEFNIQKIFHKDLDGSILNVVASVFKLKHKLEFNKLGEIIIPDDVRVSAENAIEHFANITSLSNYSSRKIFSGTPTVALRPDSDSEIKFLEKCSGFSVPDGVKILPKMDFNLDIDLIINNSQDRLDGVAIAVEALGYKQASGRFRESIRIFERAFAKAGKSMIVPLSSFLADGFGIYSESEVENWISIRDGITHADRKDKLIFDGDVAWIVGRSTQAMYDVLLNKTNWRSPDTDRRSVWKPDSYTVDKDGSLGIKKSTAGSIGFELFDEYRRFPRHLNANLTSAPVGWWVGPESARPKREHIGSGKIWFEE